MPDVLTLQRLPPPTSDEVHVWTLTLTACRRGLEGFNRLLSGAEGAAQIRFVREADRARFALSRGGRRALLAAYLDRSPRALAFEENEQGKARLAAGSSPLDLRFNVSHSGDVVRIAVTRGREIGIDVEEERDLDDLEPLALRSFSPREVAQLEQIPRPGKVGAFFLCWTRKEAVIKAIGLGLSFPLEAFDVELRPGAPARLLASRDPRLDAPRWSMASVPSPPGYASALLVEGGPPAIRLFDGLATPP